MSGDILIHRVEPRELQKWLDQGWQLCDKNDSHHAEHVTLIWKEVMSDPKGTIMISLKNYEELIKVRDMLAALEACGVDNWAGYDYALEMFHDFCSEGCEDEKTVKDIYGDE